MPLCEPKFHLIAWIASDRPSRMMRPRSRPPVRACPETPTLFVMFMRIAATTAALFIMSALHGTTAEMKSPETFDYEWAGKNYTMQKYFIVFLKTGPTRSQDKEEAAGLQKQHLAYLGDLYEKGIINLNGPTGGPGDIRGFSVYNVATIEEAEALASADPMVKAGRLVIEVHPWWLAKGSSVK